jgi:hypothetical protein
MQKRFIYTYSENFQNKKSFNYIVMANDKCHFNAAVFRMHILKLNTDVYLFLFICIFLYVCLRGWQKGTWCPRWTFGIAPQITSKNVRCAVVRIKILHL